MPERTNLSGVLGNEGGSGRTDSGGLLALAADLARLSYDDRIPDDVVDEMRRKALLLRDEYDRGRRVEKLTPSRQRTVKVCPICGTDCPTCGLPSDQLADPREITTNDLAVMVMKEDDHG